MNNMKTIKIFLASSEELADDRKEFGNLIRRLDDIYQRRGIHIKLIMWEDLDMTFKDRRKQDEYNDVIRECHVFIALFYKLAGQYTREELEVANRDDHGRVPRSFSHFSHPQLHVQHGVGDEWFLDEYTTESILLYRVLLVF